MRGLSYHYAEKKLWKQIVNIIAIHYVETANTVQYNYTRSKLKCTCVPYLYSHTLQVSHGYWRKIS